jgi:cytidine deaminase
MTYVQDMDNPLTSQEQLTALREAAYAGRLNGWRPYSKFPVAAAVMTVDGRIYGGAGNVECANFTLTKHAEETAVCAALADGALPRCGRAFLQAVYIPTVAGARAMPCGGCRQFLWEFSDENTLIVNEMPDGSEEFRALVELLPEPFGPRDLGITDSDNPTGA